MPNSILEITEYSEMTMQPWDSDWIKRDGDNINCIDYCITSHSSTARKTPRNTRYTFMFGSETSLTRGPKIRGPPFDDR